MHLCIFITVSVSLCIYECIHLYCVVEKIHNNTIGRQTTSTDIIFNLFLHLCVVPHLET
jgi:hypothetical protein